MLDFMLANSSWWNKTFWFAWRDTEDVYPLIDYQTDEPYPHYYTFKSYTNPPSITVTSPNGGESWVRGRTYSIQWTSNEVTNVKIELWKGGVFNATITASTPASTGLKNWFIPATQALSTVYKIRITSIDDGSVLSDSSNANFSITPGLPDVIITSITLSPAAPTTGQKVTIMARITNQGNAPTPSGVYVGVGFKIDSTYLGAFFVMNGSNFSSLAAGASYTAACGT